MSIQRVPRVLLAALPAALILLSTAGGQAAGDPPLVVAARSGDLQTVRALLAKGASANTPGSDGSTALLWAVYHSNPDMTKALITAGAPVNAPNRYGVTPLIQASRTGDAPMIAMLLEAGADARTKHPDGSTALMAAARTGHVDAVRLLLDAGSDVNAFEAYQEQDALMWASAEGHVNVVTLLLDRGANPNRKARQTTITERKHADHPTGGFTALMFAARNGHEAAATALVKGGADTTLTNGDGLTATNVAISNDRFDLARTLLELGADPNDGSLYFAVDMHDATTDMRAHDGSRLRADHPNTLTALDLVRLLLDRGADPNKPFTGQLHSTTLCCAPQANASPFYRAAIAADVEVLKLMLAKGARVEWTPSEVKGEGAAAGGAGRGANANVGKTPIMVAMVGGRGAPFAAGPGFSRVTAPPFREPSSRDPVEALDVLLKAGADPNAKAPDGSTPLHQAVQARQVPVIHALVAAGAKLDATNKENLTPLQLAEKPEPAGRGANADPDAYQFKRNTRNEVIAALRELMQLGPDDPTPVPPAATTTEAKKDEAPKGTR